YVRDSKLDYFNVTATFSEPVTGFTAGDVLLGGTSHQADHWSVPAIYGEPGGASYGFSVENKIWKNGSLTFEIPAGKVTDLAGNPVAASNQVKVILDTARPVASHPTTSLRSDTTLGDGALRGMITWTGRDATSGVASYDVARSFDGGRFRVIKTGVSGTSLNWNLRTGHSYRFEVRARDKAGNVGAWSAGVTLKPTRIQQNSSLVHFSGASRTTFLSAYSGGSQRHLGTSGASATLQTKARALSFVTTRGPERGQVAI